MAALDTAAQTNPNINPIPGSSFSSAFTAYSKDFFLEMQGNLQDFLTAKIQQVLPYWSSSAAIKDFTKSGATQVANALATKLANVATDVVINAGFVQ